MLTALLLLGSLAPLAAMLVALFTAARIRDGRRRAEAQASPSRTPR